MINESLLLASGVSVCAAAACALALQLRAGVRRPAAWLSHLALAASAGLALALVAYGRHPLSTARAAVALGVLSVALGTWPATLLSLGRARLAARWRLAVVVQGSLTLAAGAVVAVAGVDWVTHIGADALLIPSRAGTVALALAGVPAVLALPLLAWQFGAHWARMPRLFLGLAGVLSSQLALWASLLLQGYATSGAITVSLALGAVSSLVWLAGLVREVPAAPRFVPSRTLVYGLVAGALVFTYALAAGAAVGWVEFFGRAAAAPELEPALAFAGIALLVVAWARWRRPLWVAINRHVFGSKYDHGEVWIRLAAIVSGGLGPLDLMQRTADLCRELIGAGEVSVWAADSAGRLRCAARARERQMPEAPRAVDQPFQLEPDEVDDADLARATRSSFACPLRVAGHIVGVLAAGGPQAPAALDEEDRELLRHVSAQLAGALGIYRLGEELADAREMASFHRLSGFVIHDLKNLAVQQSFVLENAARHGRDPRFIEDALAAFADSTRRMRALIDKLREKEPPSAAGRASCDLRDVVRQLLATPGLTSVPGCRIESILPAHGAHCRAQIDGAALLQVLNHLVVNAIESLNGESGRVRIEVQPDGDDWRVAVADDGCGMSSDYLREHAFRPFRTTKPGGMGVGLHQCKSILDAVGGRISIASVEGRGTTVRITLHGCPYTAALEQVA